MKRIFQMCFGLAFFSLGYSQELKPVAQKVRDIQAANKTFVKYDLFTANKSAGKQQLYRTAAEDITVMDLNKSEIQRINTERPEALEMSFPFEGKNITLELVKNELFTQDFKVTTDKGDVQYTPGVYYQGIVKGDVQSLVAVSFFNNDVMGVTSIKDIGNIIIGKAKNSDDFVSYNDQKLKGSNPFACSTDEVLENQSHPVSFDPEILNVKKTDNCVRIYYEVGYGPYTQNGSNVTTTTNWLTGMHNNIKTLYQNDGITVALSTVYVWTTTDPYSGDPSTILGQFRSTRTTFNGDVAQLVRNPATTSIAYVNTLCTTSNYSYSGVEQSYQNVPTYSWNIEAMTHEIGHNLGSPHTHDCVWNGNNTRIDGCGPASGNAGNGTCAAGPLPTGTGGTIMSYCHLVGSVGINFANGFGPQPGALIRNRVNSSSCLGTNCITPCAVTATGLAVSEVTKVSAKATITDNTGTSWRYSLTKGDGTLVSTGVTTNKVMTFTNLEPGSYYFVYVGPECTGPQAYQFRQLIFTDADWCSGVLFTDAGGANANYTDNLSYTKTFYPNTASNKLKLTFTEFDTEPSGDYIIVYDGPSIASPRFAGTSTISGTTIPGPFTATNAQGAITVRFISNTTMNRPGWKATFECITLGTDESVKSNAVAITKTSANGVFRITSKDKILNYSVYDASGKLTSTNKVNGTENELNLSRFPAGTYVINIVTDKETITKKVIR